MTLTIALYAQDINAATRWQAIRTIVWEGTSASYQMRMG